MKIQYKTILCGECSTGYNKPDDIYEIKQVGEVSPCCPRMEEALSREFIKFGEFEPILNNVSSMCIYHCFPYPEGVSWDEMPILFCPFCAEPIETVEVERVKLKKTTKKIPARTEVDYCEVPVDKV